MIKFTTSLNKGIAVKPVSKRILFLASMGLLAHIGVASAQTTDTNVAATTTVSNAAQSTSVALPVLDTASDKRNFDLLQGQWRCQSSVAGADDKLKLNMSMVSNEHFQGGLWTGERHDNILARLRGDNGQWESGYAYVIERGRSVIQKIANNVIYERMVSMDDDQWVGVDDNAAGQYIRKVFFPSMVALAEQQMREQKTRLFYIDQLDEERLVFHDESTPATQSTCQRVAVSNQPS